MKRPDTIEIGGRAIRLQWRPAKDMKDCLGQFVYAKGKIEVARGQLEYDEADTVLHEILHAILHLQGREEDPDTEERFVRALATGLLPVLRNNPALTTWLMRPLKR